MRNIDYIVVHCTATKRTASVEAIVDYWKSLKWNRSGYHKIITASGHIHTLERDEDRANGARGFNENSLHVAYIGGEHTDDRTNEQKEALIQVIKRWLQRYPEAKVIGHRDLNPRKECPRFSAFIEYQDLKPYEKPEL